MSHSILFWSNKLSRDTHHSDKSYICLLQMWIINPEWVFTCCICLTKQVSVVFVKLVFVKKDNFLSASYKHLALRNLLRFHLQSSITHIFQQQTEPFFFHWIKLMRQKSPVLPNEANWLKIQLLLNICHRIFLGVVFVLEFVFWKYVFVRVNEIQFLMIRLSPHLIILQRLFVVFSL